MPQNLEKVAEQLDKGDEATRDFKGIYQVWALRAVSLVRCYDPLVRSRELCGGQAPRAQLGKLQSNRCAISRHVAGGA